MQTYLSCHNQKLVKWLKTQREAARAAAMQHKNNPVLSAALVTIAKMNEQLQSQRKRCYCMDIRVECDTTNAY